MWMTLPDQGKFTKAFSTLERASREVGLAISVEKTNVYTLKNRLQNNLTIQTNYRYQEHRIGNFRCYFKRH